MKEADSKNDSLTGEEKKKIKGEKVETIKNYFSQDLSDKETIIVGYAFLEDESEEERAALQRRLEKTFGTEHLLYLAGDKEDVENAKKAGKSLGIYLAGQILTGEDFNKVVNEVTEEEILELLEKNPSFIENPVLKKSIQEKLSDYEDADDLEKEEETDHDENEDILEQQNEKQEEQGETDQTDETDKSGDSKDADEPDATDEPENPDDERKEEETESTDQSKETVDNDEDVSDSSIEPEEED